MLLITLSWARAYTQRTGLGFSRLSTPDTAFWSSSLWRKTNRWGLQGHLLDVLVEEQAAVPSPNCSFGEEVALFPSSEANPWADFVLLYKKSFSEIVQPTAATHEAYNSHRFLQHKRPVSRTELPTRPARSGKLIDFWGWRPKIWLPITTVPSTSKRESDRSFLTDMRNHSITSLPRKIDERPGWPFVVSRSTRRTPALCIIGFYQLGHKSKPSQKHRI